MEGGGKYWEGRREKRKGTCEGGTLRGGRVGDPDDRLDDWLCKP